MEEVVERFHCGNVRYDLQCAVGSYCKGQGGQDASYAVSKASFGWSDVDGGSLGDAVRKRSDVVVSLPGRVVAADRCSFVLMSL